MTAYHDRQQLRQLQTRVRRYERILWFSIAFFVFLTIVNLTLLIK
jgi:hypothetical protein